MKLQSRNKRSLEFSSASMSDLVFLLLIFFMLTSTMISPNAIKLLLPSSSSERVLAPNKPLSVTIDEKFQYYIDNKLVNEDELRSGLRGKLSNSGDASVLLSSDASVPVQFVVNVIDIVNEINKETKSKHKVVLATKPR